MTDEERATILWTSLNNCLSLDKDLTLKVVSTWLEHHGAGSPDVSFMQERVRDDAKFWAMAALPIELEAYVAAGVVELERSPIANRALKRLAALAYRGMDAASRLSFLEWAKK